MCLIACAFHAYPNATLVVAGNRDEFHDRPAAAADHWQDAPQVIGGRDLTAGGSWLAVAPGRLAAVTNVRRMDRPNPDAPSRGDLVARFVTGTESAAAAAAALLPEAHRYAGFNLLLWDGAALHYLSNRIEPCHRVLGPGIYGLSNAALDTPWPKVAGLRAQLHEAARHAAPTHTLFTALRDERRPDDTDLPDTGVGQEMERFLSPAFIRDRRYGTRASTVVTAGPTGIELIERAFGPEGVPLGERRLEVGA